MELLEEVHSKNVVRENHSENHAQQAAGAAHEERFTEKRTLQQASFASEGAQHADLLAAFNYRTCARNGKRRYSEQQSQADYSQQHITEQDARPAHCPDGVLQYGRL